MKKCLNSHYVHSVEMAALRDIGTDFLGNITTELETQNTLLLPLLVLHEHSCRETRDRNVNIHTAGKAHVMYRTWSAADPMVRYRERGREHSN